VNIKLDKLPESLPVKAQADLSGKEVYFSVPISVSAEATAKTVGKPREICFWPPENAIALCYSPTPLSNGNECRPASKANLFEQLNEPQAVASKRACDPILVSLID
tara:strand:- start:6311 stop:6628 length:318 start_codon:yes stop_codon:yes gene_type:complete